MRTIASTSRLLAVLVLLAACGGADDMLGPTGPPSAPPATIDLRPAIDLGATDGQTVANSLHMATAGDSMVAAVTLQDRGVVVRRFGATGTPSEAELGMGRTLAIAGRSNGEAVVTWRRARDAALVHTFIAADGAVQETVSDGAFGDYDRVVMTSATTLERIEWRDGTMTRTLLERTEPVLLRCVGDT